MHVYIICQYVHVIYTCIIYSSIIYVVSFQKTSGFHDLNFLNNFIKFSLLTSAPCYALLGDIAPIFSWLLTLEMLPSVHSSKCR